MEQLFEELRGYLDGANATVRRLGLRVKDQRSFDKVQALIKRAMADLPELQSEIQEEEAENADA